MPPEVLRPSNGTVAAPAPGDAAPDEWQRIEQAYREIQRRDDRAEHRAWRWERFALTLLGLWLVTLGIMVWQWLGALPVQAFFQGLLQDDKGALPPRGI